MTQELTGGTDPPEALRRLLESRKLSVAHRRRKEKWEGKANCRCGLTIRNVLSLLMIEKQQAARDPLETSSATISKGALFK